MIYTPQKTFGMLKPNSVMLFVESKSKQVSVIDVSGGSEGMRVGDRGLKLTIYLHVPTASGQITLSKFIDLWNCFSVYNCVHVMSLTLYKSLALQRSSFGLIKYQTIV